MIYPVDSVIQPLNNPGQMFTLFTGRHVGGEQSSTNRKKEKKNVWKRAIVVDRNGFFIYWFLIKLQNIIIKRIIEGVLYLGWGRGA